MNRLAFLAAATAAAVTIAAPAAAGPAWEFTAPGNSFSNGSWNFANKFTVLNTVTVSGLGWYADPNTGNVDSNPVALYRCDTAGCLTTGTLLAQVTVDNTYALQGHFRFVTVPSVALTPGEYLVAGVSDTNNYTWNDTGFTVDSNITYDDNRWFQTVAGAAPGFNNVVRNDVNDGYWGPNLFFGAPVFAGVPEPTTWALMILGFGMVGGAMRRRQARTTVRFAA